MPTIHNTHARTIEASAATVGSLLDGLATDGDVLWPAPAWPPLHLDRPLGVGARGGHGPIPYTVSIYEPGRRVRFDFDPSLGIAGYHEAYVEDRGPDTCALQHVLHGRPAGAAPFLRWHLIIRWLHDAMIEDLLDKAEQAATGRVAHPARWSLWVQPLRRVVRARQTHSTRPTRRSAEPGRLAGHECGGSQGPAG